MAQFTDDFSSYATGVGVPSGWTLHPSFGTASGIEIVEDGAVFGGKFLRVPGASRQLWNNALGDVADVELLMRYRSTSFAEEHGGQLAARSIGTHVSNQTHTYAGYVLNNSVKIYNYVSGSRVQLSSAGIAAPATNTWYWARFKITGEQRQFKTWVDGAAEPAYQNTITSASVASAGKAGLHFQAAGAYTVDVDFFSAGTAGDPAPFPAGFGNLEETAEGIQLLLGDAEETIGVGVIVETAEGITSLWGDATELAADPVIETAEGMQLLLSDTEDTIALTETAEGIQRLLGDVTDVAVSEADENVEGLQLLLTDVVDTIALTETAEGIQLLLGDVEDEAATGFAELDAELPNLEATIHQGALFSAELPQIDGDFRAYARPIATLDALLPALEATIYTAHKVNAELPSLQAHLSAETDQPLSLDAELPALEAQFNLQVDLSPTLNAELPALEASFVTAHKLSATLPALEAALSLPVSGVISLSAALPALYFDASVVTSGTATLDATLPALEARSILLGLSAELPSLTARISSSTLVETLTKTAYALNTETGALTDFANFQFLKLGTLNGKLYGLTSAGRLVRLEGDTDDGEPILGYLLTHSDDRIYNDIGELVRTDYLRRCYGVYLKSRNLQGVQVELINDELDKITYPVMPQMRAGLVNYRVDTYRGIMSHYWALGLRTQGGRFDLFSAALILESLDRKVW